MLRLMLLPRLLRSMLIVRGLVAESCVVMVAERDGFVRVGAGRQSGRRIE